MAKFAVQTLEFAKVKELLAAQTATSLGHAQALNLQVASSYSSVKELQEETAEALRTMDEGRSFPFGGITDITAIARQAEIGGILTPAELLAIANAAEGMGALRSFLLTITEGAPHLSSYAAQMQEFPRLVKQLNGAISEKGELKDTASVKLGGLRTGILVAQRRVKEKLESILHSADYQKYFQDQLVTVRENRYVIPIKAEYKMNFPGIVHDQSGSGATLFIEPMAVVNLNNDIKRYSAEAKEEEERILRTLSAAVGSEAKALMSTVSKVTQLDVVCAKAYLAQKMHCCRPMLLLKGRVEIAGGRHPLLDSQKVVPLDIELGQKFTILLITGPNTGGKTVALKTVGLFALMAQAGLFLPALAAKLPVFRGIYADIGDEQSIEQSLSTFSSHMTNLVGILREVTADSLVLIDEICVGTDPSEGAALAMSILNYLLRQKTLAIVTTHYSELKTFAYEQEGLENASVEFDPVSLAPTYRLLMGIPGSSNAFYISKRLGLDTDILTEAQSLLGSEHAHMEDVLQNLEGERRTYESRNREIEELRNEAEKLRNELRLRKAEIDRQRGEILRKAREEADALYRESRRETEEVIAEVRRLRKAQNEQEVERVTAKARKALDKNFALDSKEAPEGKSLSSSNVRVGAKVYLTTLGQRGLIDSISGKKVVVRVGNMKTTVPMADCVLLSEASSQTKGASNKTGTKLSHELFLKKVNSVLQEIDVRGMTVDEAIPIVAKAIDDALITGMDKFRIVHGKGTGQLRAGLTAYLKGSPEVAKIEIADQSQGGMGATVVTLK